MQPATVKTRLTGVATLLATEAAPWLSCGETLVAAAPRPVEWGGDADRIEQVVMNLLSNAIKYSPDGGTITLSLHRVGDDVILEVADQGMGLSAEQISHLFQKFYRTFDARSRGIKGTGLGLNLVKKIVTAHGSSIEVLSERDAGGIGATFRICLPIAMPAPPTQGRRFAPRLLKPF